MGKFTKGELDTYTVTPDVAAKDPSLTEGDELVFLPLSVGDDGAASGLAFTHGGMFPVVIPADPPPDPAADPNAAPQGVNTADWQAFQAFRAEQSAPKPAAPADVPASPSPTEQGPATTTTPEPTGYTTEATTAQDPAAAPHGDATDGTPANTTEENPA